MVHLRSSQVTYQLWRITCDQGCQEDGLADGTVGATELRKQNLTSQPLPPGFVLGGGAVMGERDNGDRPTSVLLEEDTHSHVRLDSGGHMWYYGAL